MCLRPTLYLLCSTSVHAGKARVLDEASTKYGLDLGEMSAPDNASFGYAFKDCPQALAALLLGLVNEFRGGASAWLERVCVACSCKC